MATGKPYIVSISGLSMDDNMAMLDRIYDSSGISAIELNFACPNVPDKPMVAYDFDQMESALQRVCSHPKFRSIPLGVKLAPYFDLPHFERVASLLARHPIKYIVSINTIGNGLVVDGENECAGMAARGGLGGMGGGFVKHAALANVRQFYQLFKQMNRGDIDIVGVGGVHSGMDAFELILCGAKAVQVGTCHWTEGPECFDRIVDELLDIMRRKGYRSIEDFRGKLKNYVKPARTNKSEEEDRLSKPSGKTTELRSVPDTVHSILLAIIAMLVFAVFYLYRELQAYQD
ncbi:dihydroorotate oxidase [archaeon]|nr:MAG: dihydroorotate oxidase [archaeon]